MIRLALYHGHRRLRFINHGQDTAFFEGGREWSISAFGWVVFLNVMEA